MSISDAFCLSSLQEGLPITALEAFSVGTPVISTPVGGCVNIVTDGKTGFLSKDVSENSYMQAIKMFVGTSEEKRNSMRSSCLNEFNEKYSIDRCAKEYINEFNK